MSRPTDLHSFKKEERDGDTGTYRAQRRGVDNRENTKDAGKRRQVSSKLDGRHIGRSVVIDFCSRYSVLLLKKEKKNAKQHHITTEYGGLAPHTLVKLELKLVMTFRRTVCVDGCAAHLKR